jgi:uncharacterized protein (DUF58 family)
VNATRKIDGALRLALVWVVLAGLGWWLRSAPLAVLGVLGAVATVALWIWQRECLTGVSYRRTLGQTRATFGERVELSTEIVNDKLLPLSWLHVTDRVPPVLDIEGGTVISEPSHISRLVQVLPMLPYQRVRHRFTVVCTYRGEHIFGPSELTSGDPLGLRSRSARVDNRQRLLVYPKLFALAPAGIVSRVLAGDRRSRFELIEDPSRIAGIREYRRGDPLRSVDWRATARSTTVLVRQFEPTVTLRVALFVDLRAPRRPVWSLDAAEVEFTVAVAASVLADLAASKVAAGLFSCGVASGGPLAFPASRAPSSLALMLEALAKVSPSGSTPFAEVISTHGPRLARGTSALVVAADFPEATVLALSELRRHHPVTALWVQTGRGTPPPPALVDRLVTVRYSDDWQRREILELAL